MVETLKEEWDGFCAATVHPEAGERQLADLKAAFYAGAFAFWNMLCDTEKLDDEACDARIETLTRELLGFMDEVTKGKADL